MADSVSFKAYLKRDGQEVEIRRFSIDAGAAASYLYLRGKIQAVFPSLKNDTFVVYWQDQEGDDITMSTDEELLVALTSGISQPFKIYVHIQPSINSAGAGEDNLHLGVICDSCDGEVRGSRYKCTKCPDYDLCANCSTAGHHTEHVMIRIPYEPLNTAENLFHPKLVHKMMKRQHKFHKHHGWNRLHERGNRGQESAGRCSFKRPPCPAADIFNVSTLSDFLKTLVVGEETEAASAPAQPGASASAQATNAQTTNAQTTNAQASNAQASNAQASNTQTTNAEANKREAWNARARKQAALIRKSLGVDEEVAGNSRPDHSSNSPPQNAAPRANNSARISIGDVITSLMDNFLDPLSKQMIFDGQSRSGQPMPASNTATTAGGVSPSTSTAAPNTTSGPTAAGSDTATPATTAAIYPELPTPPSHETSASPRQGSPTARRNSDDWTLLNRESPVRGETVAMEIEGETHPRDLTLMFGTAAASAPAPNPQPVDAEKKRIDDCLEKLRAMGFDLGPDTQILRDLLAKENCDIASVLDILLNNARK